MTGTLLLPDKARLDRYLELRAALEQKRREVVPLVDPAPMSLARRLDNLLVQTPALDIVDQEMVRVRDALLVMFERRRLFAELANGGMDVASATQQAATDVPQKGNTRLLLSMPPQEGKTTAVSRYGVLWLLRQFSNLRLVIVSFDGMNANRMSRLSREDVQLFDGTAGNPDMGLRLARDQRAVSRWSLTNGCEVYAIGIGGGLTGRPVDLLLIDDPVKDDQTASSELRSSHGWLWWMGVGRPRLAPDAPVIVVGTRWHEADLIGRLEAKQDEDEKAGVEHFDRWRNVNIPAQADHDPAAGQVDILGREPGEFMVSARGRTTENWEATKNATATRQWTALYQGQPSPATGTVWLKEWWRRYGTPMWSKQDDGTYRVECDRLVWSWDMAFKALADSDYVCGQLWAKVGSQAFLIYSVWDRLDFPKSQEAVKRGHLLFPQAHTILVEDKANGPAIISSLETVVPGLTPVNVAGNGKVARAEAVSPFLKAGNVHVPTMEVALADPQLVFDPEGLIFEATAFPFGRHDDQVDAASQALAELYLVGGVTEVHVPQGRIPTGPASSRTGGTLSPMQRRLSERAGARL